MVGLSKRKKRKKEELKHEGKERNKEKNNDIMQKERKNRYT